jgi:hypothetical protein
MVDMVVPRKDLKETMGRILNLLMNRTGSLNQKGSGSGSSAGKAGNAKSGMFAGKSSFAPHATVNQLTPANDPADVQEPTRASGRASKK